jgi:hypothetical protein
VDGSTEGPGFAPGLFLYLLQNLQLAPKFHRPHHMSYGKLAQALLNRDKNA